MSEPASEPSKASLPTTDGPAGGSASGGKAVDAASSTTATGGQTVDLPTGEFQASATDTPPDELANAARLEKLRIPGYEILSVLGHGGMGVVYKARDTKLDRLVALKMVLAGVHASANEIKRFVQEAKAVAKFHHLNIVQIYEINEVDGLPYFSLEFVDGTTLARQLDHKPQPLGQAAEMVETLARAMSYAHERGIIHRDLKPANVLLTRDGTPKIADFGLAKQLDEAGQTHTGTAVGTPNYMAPEQAAGHTHLIGPASDQFSLGVVLYEMLTGHPPFTGANMLDTLEQVRSREPIPPSQLVEKVPRDLETICLKCLHKEPARRYASTADLAADLRRFLNGEPIQARPVGDWERLARWCRRNPRVAILGGSVAVLLLAVAVISTVFAVKISHKNDDLETAANTERQLRTVAETRLERNRELTDSFVNVIPDMLDGAIYTKHVQQEFLERRNEFQDRPDDSDDRELRQRGELGRLLRRGNVFVTERKENEALPIYLEGEKLALAILDGNPRQKDKSAGNLAVVYLKLGETYMNLRDLARAREYYERALPINRKLVREPQSGELTPNETRTSLATALGQYAVLLLRRGEYQAGLLIAQESISEWDQIPPSELTARRRDNMATAASTLGKLAYSSGDLSGGRAAYERCISLRQGLAKEHPLNLKYKRDLAYDAADWGDFELLHGSAPLALKQYELSLPLYVRLALPPEVFVLQRGVSQMHYRLAVAAQKTGNADAAAKHFDACHELRKAELKAQPDHDGVKIGLMLVQARCGDYLNAEKYADWLEQLVNKQKAPGQKAYYARLAASGFALCGGVVPTGNAPPQDKVQLRKKYFDRAFANLETAVANGYKNVVELRTDPDFDPIRPEPRFQALLARLKPADSK